MASREHKSYKHGRGKSKKSPDVERIKTVHEMNAVWIVGLVPGTLTKGAQEMPCLYDLPRETLDGVVFVIRWYKMMDSAHTPAM